MNSLAIDLQGPWPTSTRKRFKYTLTAIDLTTRYSWVVGLKEATSLHIAKALFEEVFPMFGIPTRVHSDLGTNLVSEFLSEFLKLMGVKKRTTTTSRHASSNSTVERLHYTVNSFLRKQLNGISSGEWERHLTVLNYVLRHSYMSSIGASPSYLMTGCSISPYLFDARAPRDQDAIPRDDFEQFTEDMEAMRKSHREWLLHQQEASIKKFDRKAVKVIRKLKIGDIVVIRDEKHQIGAKTKLEFKYSQPLRIVDIDPSRHTYKLQNIQTGENLPNRWNYTLLRKCLLPAQNETRQKYDKEITRRTEEMKGLRTSKKLRKIKRRPNTHDPDHESITDTTRRIQPHRKCKSTPKNEEVNMANLEPDIQMRLMEQAMYIAFNLVLSPHLGTIADRFSNESLIQQQIKSLGTDRPREQTLNSAENQPCKTQDLDSNGNVIQELPQGLGNSRPREMTQNTANHPESSKPECNADKIEGHKRVMTQPSYLCDKITEVNHPEQRTGCTDLTGKLPQVLDLARSLKKKGLLYPDQNIFKRILMEACMHVIFSAPRERHQEPW